MAESVLKLKVESTEYNNKIKRAAEGLQQYADRCRKAGGTLEVVEKDTVEFAKSLGRMETVSKTAKGSLNEMTKAFTDLKMQYKQLTDAEKASPYGKALNDSLDQLKGRIREAQNDLKSINQELQGGNGKFGQFGSILDGIGQKMGINANITELLTSRTALLTGAIGASATAVVAATKAWSDYNAEIAKQQQITTVTTGLKGDDAERMTAAARALSKTYNVDFREAINAANILMSQFGKTGDESIQLLRDGMRGMIQGDGSKLLSMIQQYAPSFRDAGVSASQLVAVIQNSEGGIFTDQNMNAIVMGIKNIRLMTKATSDALAQLGIDGQAMTKALNEGSVTVFDALKQVAGQLKNVDSNSQAAGQVMQQVFGRQGAMAGTNLAKAIETLNLNLEETKKQTGSVGDAFDELYRANERFEKALQQTFGYNGWEQMATGIKTTLVAAMAEVLEKVNKINEAFETNYGVSFFDGIFNAATNVLGPMGKVLQALRDINKEKSGGGSGSGSSELDDAFKYIKSGTDRAEREKRYDSQLSDINKRLADIGQEKTRKNADGSTSFYIDDPAEQQRQRTQLLNQRTQLVLSRDKLLNSQSNQVTPIIPIVPEPKNPKGGTKTQKTEEQLNSEQIQKLTQEYQKLATAEKTASEAQLKDIDVRKSAIQTEIGKLQDRNKELARFASEAKGVNISSDSLPGLTQQLKELQTAQAESANGREWDDYQKKIDDVTAKINVLKGVLPKDQQATFTVTVNAEQLEQLRMLLPSDEETVRINVEEGRVDLPDIPTEIEQVVNTKVGDVVTPKIATDIVQTISTRLGSIVTPDIAETLTQVINTKVGDVITPDIAEELTQVVNVMPGRVDLPELPKDETVRVNITATTADAMKEVRNMVGEIKGWQVAIEPKIEIKEEDLRTPFEKLQDSIKLELSAKNVEVDKNTLKSLTEVVTKYDIQTGTIDTSKVMAQTEELTKGGMGAGAAYAKALQDAMVANLDLSTVQQRIGEEINIPNETWQALQDQINEKLKGLGIEPIQIDFSTGNVKKQSKEMSKDWKEAAQAIQSVGSAMASIEDPAAKVIGTIAQAVASIALGYAQASASPAVTSSGWGWIAFAASGLATMISTISAIHSATGYAEGGMIKGNSYSGDNIAGLVDGSQLVGLNAGEIVLNQAMAGNVARGLEGNAGGKIDVVGEIQGEKIVLVANRYFKRTGQGEIVTWR